MEIQNLDSVISSTIKFIRHAERFSTRVQEVLEQRRHAIKKRFICFDENDDATIIVPSKPVFTTTQNPEDELATEETPENELSSEATPENELSSEETPVFRTFKLYNIEWVGNASENGGAQNKVLSEREPNQITIHSAAQYGRIWTNVTPIQLLTLIHHDINLMEVISLYPHKVYFDVDKKPDDTPADVYLSKILSSINNIFPDADIAVSGSITSEKLSYHICLHNYLIQDEVEKEKLKQIAGWLYDNVSEGFDKSVYSRNRNMKTLNQSKPPTPQKPLRRVQRILQNSTTTKHFITCFFPEDFHTLENTAFEFTEATIAPKRTHTQRIISSVNISTIPEITEEEKACFEVKVLELWKPSRYDSRVDWLNLGILIKCLNLNISVWKYISKNSTKYIENDDSFITAWNSFDREEFTIGTALHFAKKDNEARLDELLKTRSSINLDEEPIKVETIKFESRYLLDMQRKLDDATTLAENINKFFEDPSLKTLNIKSPYDTGKTQLIKAILNKQTNVKQILWLSYRQTLTTDVEQTMGEFKFKSYLDGAYDAERLIVQVESLGKLFHFANIGKRMKKVPSYDMVIIDEAESVLRQYHSTATFKGLSFDTFNLMVHIIRSSLKTGKLITLDGAMSNRTYNFIETFGASINLVNNINFNTKTLLIRTNTEQFIKDALDDLADGQKLVVPTMSSQCGQEIEARIRKQFGDTKRILFYYSKTNDADKRDIAKIYELWMQADVVIFTPTIEAGVNFDMPHFDKIYGFINSGSCTQEAFFQMLARVRKIECDNIELLNHSGLKLNEFVKPWTFQEVKGGMLFDDKLQRGQMYIDTPTDIFVTSDNELYEYNYIYNETEQYNTHPKYFLKVFDKLAKDKHFKIVYDDIIDDEPTPRKSKDKNIRIDKLVEAEDISTQEFQELYKHQERRCATEQEKYQIERYILKQKLGVDKLDATILKAFMNNDRLENFMSLYDVRNIAENDSDVFEKKKAKVSYVHLIIDKLGWTDVNSSKRLSAEEMKTNMNNLLSELSDENKHKRFNYLMNESRVNLKTVMSKGTLKSQLGFINTLLSSYCLTIMSKKQRKDKSRCEQVYCLSIDDNVDEVVEYKSNNGFAIFDENNLFLKPSKKGCYLYKYHQLVEQNKTTEPKEMEDPFLD